MTKKSDAPAIRFKGFSDAWEQRKLGEVIRLNGRIGFRGYTEKDIVTKDDGGVLTFSPTNIVDNKLTTNCKNTYITRFKYDESPEIKIHNGDILFVKTGSTLGKSALVTGLSEDATLNPQVVVMRTNNLNVEFLAAMLVTNAIISQVNSAKIGGAIPTLTETRIKDFDVAIPVSEAEKEQIGQFFSQLDHLITLHQRKCVFIFGFFQAFISMIFTASTFSWEQRKLGEIGSVSMCRRIFKEQTSETGDIPFYKIGTFGADPDAFISRELFEEYKSKYPYPQKGDILISASGSIGRAVEFAGNNEYFQDSNIVWLNHDERLSNPFLKCFYSVVKWAGIEGSTIKRLYNDNILNTVICMPSVPEQKRIGLFFENLDNLITLHQRECISFTARAGRRILTANKKRNTSSWEQRKLGDIADIVGGGTPSTGNQSYWDGDIDWYAPAEIADQIYANSSQKKITGLGYENSSAKMLPPGTVLFTSRAGIGKTAILTRKGCTNQGFQSIVPHRGELDSYFIFSRTEELKRYGELVGAGSTFVEVSGKQMAVMELMMPPTMREQQTIGGFFQQLDHLITLHQRKLDEMKKQKKALMQLLLTGIVRVRL